MNIQWDNPPEEVKVGVIKQGEVFQYGTKLYLDCGDNSEGSHTVVDLQAGAIQTMAPTVNVLRSTARVVVE